jgi:hypothetical protein
MRKRRGDTMTKDDLTQPVSVPRWVGVVLILIGAMMVVQTVYQVHADRQQNACLQSTIKELNDAIQERAAISQRNTESVNTVILGVAELIAAPDAADSQEKFAALFSTFTAEQAKLNQDRKDVPYPDFPEGKCS